MAKSLGAWAFLIGIILAVGLGIFSQGSIANWAAFTLAAIGIIVGFLNVTDKEVTPFLMAGVSLLLASYFGGQAMSALPLAKGVMDAINILFAPATIIVALKSVFAMAKE